MKRLENASPNARQATDIVPMTCGFTLVDRQGFEPWTLGLKVFASDVEKP